MRNPIQDAFDLVRADDLLIERTRQQLMAQFQPGFAARMEAVRHRQQAGRRRLTAAVAMFIVSSVITAGLLVAQTPVTAISLDLDKAYTLQLNRLNRVVRLSVHEPHTDGLLAAVLPVPELKQLELEEAVARLVAAAASAGEPAIRDDGTTIVTLATSADTVNLQADLSRRAEAAVVKALGDAGREAVIYLEYTGFDRIQEAWKLGMTPGRLNLIQKLVDLEPGARVQDFTALENKQIMQMLVDRIQDGALPAGSTIGSGSGAAGESGSKPEGSGEISGAGADEDHDGGAAADGSDTDRAGDTGHSPAQPGWTGAPETGSQAGGMAGNGSGLATGSGGSGAGHASGNVPGNRQGIDAGSGKSQDAGAWSEKAKPQPGDGGRTSGPASKVDAAAVLRIRQALARAAENARRSVARTNARSSMR